MFTGHSTNNKKHILSGRHVAGAPLSALLLFLICYSQMTFANSAWINMTYLDLHTTIANAGCYVRPDSGEPFFNIAALFAANINGKDPNQPVLYFNPELDHILNHTDQVTVLRKRGVKILLSVLGNHENAGWSCMTDDQAIRNFADQLVATVSTYHLDGIDIDDEYSKCMRNATSMLKIAREIKNHPRFKDKILTKALYSDIGNFRATDGGDKLADFLDYGWEMSYGSSNFKGRTIHYLSAGMKPDQLLLGIMNAHPYYNLQTTVSFVKKNNYRGIMTFIFNHDPEKYIHLLAQAEHSHVKVLEDCLI